MLRDTADGEVKVLTGEKENVCRPVVSEGSCDRAKQPNGPLLGVVGYQQATGRPARPEDPWCYGKVRYEAPQEVLLLAGSKPGPVNRAR